MPEPYKQPSEAVLRRCTWKQVFLKISFTGKHLYRSLFLKKSLLKKNSNTGVFLWRLQSFYEHPFFIEHLRWLLLKVWVEAHKPNMCGYFLITCWHSVHLVKICYKQTGNQHCWWSFFPDDVLHSCGQHVYWFDRKKSRLNFVLIYHLVCFIGFFQSRLS